MGLANVRLHLPGKLVGANDDGVLLKRDSGCPHRMASLKVRLSRMADGRKNLSASSWLHCLRRLAGAMTSTRRFRSAHFWAMSNPASMVLPSPTSSARIAPRESGFRKANSAASIWCGLRSTWASDRTAVSFSTLSDAQRRVSSWAMIFGVVGRQVHRYFNRRSGVANKRSGQCKCVGARVSVAFEVSWVCRRQLAPCEATDRLLLGEIANDDRPFGREQHPLGQACTAWIWRFSGTRRDRRSLGPCLESRLA